MESPLSPWSLALTLGVILAFYTVATAPFWPLRRKLRPRHAPSDDALAKAAEAVTAVAEGAPPPSFDQTADLAQSKLLSTIADGIGRLHVRGQHLAAIIESEPECVKTVDADGRLLDMNPAGLRLVGARALDDVRGLVVLDLVHPDWRDAFKAMHKAVIAGKPQTLVFKLVSITGEERWMETHAVPLEAHNGEVLHLAITRDITDKRLREAELIRAKDEAEAASQAKSEFLANMSHELRTPLTAILGHADLLSSPSPDAESMSSSVAAIRASAGHLLEAITDLLDLSRAERNQLSIDLAPCDPVAAVREVADSMMPRALDRNLTLDVMASNNIGRVRTDAKRLRQIVGHLLSNALKFTDEGGVVVEVDASATRDGHALFVRVIDTGVGIGTEHLEQLFTPFQQADNSTTRCIGGAGLGLSLSRRLAGLMGGEIEVSSKPGEGSRFTLRLDLAEDDVLEAAPTVLPSATPRSKGSESRSAVEPDAHPALRILLVEDNPVNQVVLTRMLNHLGAEVEVASNGAEGYEEAMGSVESGSPFHLVLLDMHMPVQDGYSTARALRRSHFPSPIVALTAAASAGDRAMCLEAGCDDYESKPIALSRLKAVLRQHSPGGATYAEP